MKRIFIISILLLLNSCAEHVEMFANDPSGYIKAIVILVAAMGLIFVVFTPTSTLLGKIFKKSKLGDNFFGWLIGAIIIIIGLIVLEFGVRFLFSL